MVLDNERFGETGEQISHTAAGIDIAGIARASGIIEAEAIRDMDRLPAIRQRLTARTGPFVAVFKQSELSAARS